MNIIHFLKGRLGAISKVGLLGTSVTVGLVGLNVYNYMTSTPAVQEQKIRSLSNIMASGGQLPREYSGINISRGDYEFATAEERAEKEGSLFDGGEGAVSALNNLSAGPNVQGAGRIDGRALGAGEAGLGMGANAAAEINGAARAAAGAQRGSEAGLDQSLAGKAASGGPTLQRASIAQASGSSLGSGASFGSSGGGFGGSSASAGRLAARSEGQSRIGASSISGAMPGGSTLVAATPKFEGAHASSFVGAGGRRGRTGTGINSKEGNSLRQIAVQSSKVAANAHRAANEGASPFLADTKLAAGISLEDGTTTGTDFGAVGDDSYGQNLDQKIGDISAAVDEVDTTEQERKAKRSALMKELIAMMLASVVAMITIAAVKDIPTYGQIVAGVLTGVMMLWIATFLVRAGLYIGKYGVKDAAGWTFLGLGAVCAVLVGLGWSDAVSEGINNMLDKIGSKLGVKAIEGVGEAAGKTVAQQVGTNLIGTAASSAGGGLLNAGENVISESSNSNS